MTSEPGEPTTIETDEAGLTICRAFDAPRERVFRTFTDPDELEEWFAPGDLAAGENVDGYAEGWSSALEKLEAVLGRGENEAP